MKQGFHVCLYKRKGNPQILAFVRGDEAEISMSLEDFKREILREIGSVTMVFKEKTFRARVDAAFDNVVREIKKGVASSIL